MTTSLVGSLPANSRGFDCDDRVTLEEARRMYAAGYTFAVRYLRRAQSVTPDLSAEEVDDLRAAGLAVTAVQHVGKRWMPTGPLGTNYGAIAVAGAQMALLPAGTHVWCDLEDVSSAAIAYDVLAYCNAWHDAVKLAGYRPGLYVGDSCGLSPLQLYRSTKFDSYWGAYNLNRDREPAVRGLALKQLPYPAPTDRVAGISFEYDEDVVRVDKLGGTPSFYLPRLRECVP